MSIKRPPLDSSAETKGESSFDSLREFFRGCLLGGAVGDALGMPTERGPSLQAGQTIEEVFGGRVTTYESSPNPAFGLEAGHYTDDTQMTIAVAEILIKGRGAFDKQMFFQKLLRMAEAEEFRTIGPTLARVIKSIVRQGIEATLQQNVRGTYPSNGAAMRTAPVALLYYWDLEKLREVTIQVAESTHANPSSLAGACAISFMIATLIREKGKIIDAIAFREGLVSFITPIDPALASMIKEQRQGHGNECSVEDTIPEIVNRFLENPNDFRSGVLDEVNSDGDTDTKASLIGQLLGIKNGVSAIPKEYLEGLENGEKGRDYLQKLADQLLELSAILQKGAGETT